VRKCPVGFRPRIQSLPSVAKALNERWATDMCRVWAGRAGWTTMALVIDCHSRELLGWHLSRSGRSKTAESALEQVLIARFGTLGRVPAPFLLLSDNGLVFTSRSSTALVRSYGLRHEESLAESLASLVLARSSYLYHRARLNADEKYVLVCRSITNIFERNHGCFGYRRVTATLCSSMAEPVNHKRVQRGSKFVGNGMNACITASSPPC